MQIRVGEMPAKCRRCGGIEFAPVKKGAIGLADWFYCVGCLAQTVHADLMVQIGEEVMKQTNAFIAVHKAIADEVISPCPSWRIGGSARLVGLAQAALRRGFL